MRSPKNNWCNKNALTTVSLRTFPHVEFYPMIDKAWLCVSKTRRFYLTWHFFSYFRIKISKISNLYNLDENSSLASKTICDHIFSGLKSDHNFNIFGYVPVLYIFSSCMWQFSSSFEDGVGIYRKFVPDWIKSTRARILFPAKYRTKFEIILGEIFLK